MKSLETDGCWMGKGQVVKEHNGSHEPYSSDFLYSGSKHIMPENIPHVPSLNSHSSSITFFCNYIKLLRIYLHAFALVRHRDNIEMEKV